MGTHPKRTSDNPESRLTVHHWGEIRDRVIRAQGRYMTRTGKKITTREFVVYMLKAFLDLDETGRLDG